jgi:hypothetical protein
LLPLSASAESFLENSVDSGIIPHDVLPLAKLQIEFNVFAPRIQAYYNVYRSSVDVNKWGNCPTLFQLGTSYTCNFAEFLDWANATQTPTTPVHPKLDIHYIGKQTSPCNGIVYVHPENLQFQGIISELITIDCRISVRFSPNKDNPAKRIEVQGYFAHLDVKDTEYVVLDDRTTFKVPKGKVKSYFNEKPVNELETIALKVAHSISSFEDILTFSQAFPPYEALENTTLPKQFIDNVSQSRIEIQNAFGTSEALLFLNGQPLQGNSLNVFTILELLRMESRTYMLAKEIGVNWNLFQKILYFQPDLKFSPRFCLSLVDPHVIWLNNLELDRRYKSWSKSYRLFLHPSFTLRPIGRNVFNVQFWFDVSNEDHLSVAREMIEFVTSSVPIRFGLLPLVDSNPASKQSRLAVQLYRVFKIKGLKETSKWLKNPSFNDNDLQLNDEVHDMLLKFKQQFSVGNQGEFFLNGKPIAFSSRYQGTLMSEIQAETEIIEKLVLNKELVDTTIVTKYFCSSPKTLDRRGSFSNLEYKKEAILPLFNEILLAVPPGKSELTYSHFIIVTYGLSDELLSSLKEAHSKFGFALEINHGSGNGALITVNGKVIRLLSLSLTVDDVDLIVRRENATWIGSLKEHSSTANLSSSEFWRISSLWWHSSVNPSTQGPSYKKSQRIELNGFIKPREGSYLELNPSTNKSIVDTVMVLNPIGGDFQRVSHFLELLKIANLGTVGILWNPESVANFPLRVTQFVGRSSRSANFYNLPPAIYTLHIDTPHSWVTSSVDSTLDLDNIVLGTGEAGTSAAIFELRNLLVEGHVVELPSSVPPRGLQIQLDNFISVKADPGVDSTIVMANLGYFQLKSTPGAWNLRLRPGKSLETYEDVMESVFLDSFLGVTISLEVNKREGSSGDLLSPNKNDRTWWSKAVDFVFGNEEVINIFTVASGHLYERFASIMMRSVIEHTSHKVKFWVIEDFVSPSFKRFLPILSQKYKFDYEFVTYKWPDWLNRQTVKQRTIWGYKILFLDVLFPLDLDKIIFVDADQIVRTDLYELWSMDLKGAVYGYTPFCDSKKDIEGFRFWKEGYWKSHLRGKPYHISALYVVDLERFRQLAAGDILREQYQRLSQDPNSLSNLDQDLPNNMQHVLPIHSLPQEWLWCETWCEDETLLKAKTIDLVCIVFGFLVLFVKFRILIFPMTILVQ